MKLLSLSERGNVYRSMTAGTLFLKFGSTQELEGREFVPAFAAIDLAGIAVAVAGTVAD